MERTDQAQESSSESEQKSSNTNHNGSLYFNSKIFKPKDNKKAIQRRTTHLNNLTFEKKEHRKTRGHKVRAISTKKSRIIEKKVIQKCASHRPCNVGPSHGSLNQLTEFQMFNTQLRLVDPTPEETQGASSTELMDLSPENIDIQMEWKQDEEELESFHHIIPNSSDQLDTVMKNFDQLNIDSPSQLQKIESQSSILTWKPNYIGHRNSCTSQYSIKPFKQRKSTIDQTIFDELQYEYSQKSQE